MRKTKKEIRIGKEFIGGDRPILIQSMTNTKTTDIDETLGQIKRLALEGCKAVRVAVPDQACIKAFEEIKKRTAVPLIADIHFDYRLAIASIKAGADKIRINPGNIGGPEKVKAVTDTAGAYGIPIRIGVNSGSLEKSLVEKYGKVTPEGMVESLEKYVAMIENAGFTDLVLSLKASNVITNKAANESASERFDYPLHIGVTEAGTYLSAAVKSSVGLGSLLLKGIGDTIRVSVAGDPVKEIAVAKEILNACGLSEDGIELIACPTCGRANINTEEIAGFIQSQKYESNKKITIAVMGCEVNGPGEAKEADIGIAGGKKDALLFFKGKPHKKVQYENIKDVLNREILNLIKERERG